MDQFAEDRRRPPQESMPIQPQSEDGDSSLGPIPELVDLGIEPEAADDLLPHVDNFVKWEVLRFLSENPEMSATVEELARYTGRDETELKPSARALAGAGLLNQRESAQPETGVGYAYSLTDDERMRRLASGLVAGFTEDRLVRLAISSHILKAQRLSRTQPTAG